MKTIYVSGPYSAPTYCQIRKNVHAAAKVGASCIEKGWAALVPHCNSHAIAKHIERAWGDWILMDLALIDKCDAILMMSNWIESEGAKREHSYALSKNIPVFYECMGIPWERETSFKN